ncbi:MAG: hypothetical protein ABEI74_04805 [Candidatus Pacearchaeota archaeon]
MAEPKYTSQIGQYQLAAWENKTNEGYTVLKFSLQKSYKDQQGNWQNPTINLSGIQSVRELPTILQQLAQKAEMQIEAFRKEQEKNQAPQQPENPKPANQKNFETQKI